MRTASNLGKSTRLAKLPPQSTQTATCVARCNVEWAKRTVVLTLRLGPGSTQWFTVHTINISSLHLRSEIYFPDGQHWSQGQGLSQVHFNHFFGARPSSVQPAKHLESLCDSQLGGGEGGVVCCWQYPPVNHPACGFDVAVRRHSMLSLMAGLHCSQRLRAQCLGSDSLETGPGDIVSIVGPDFDELGVGRLPSR